jgi:hypothetical protein
MTRKHISAKNSHATLFSGVTPRNMKIGLDVSDLESYFCIKQQWENFESLIPDLKLIIRYQEKN